MARWSNRPIRIEGDIAYVTLTKGQESMIDAEDAERVGEHDWSAMPNSTGGYYATCGVKGPDGKRRTTYLHRFVTDAPQGKVVDHVNHDTLDNRKGNLRVGSNRDNSFNRRGPARLSSTGHRGVTTHTTREGYKMYVARVTIAKYFPHTPEGLEAAAAKARELQALLQRIDPNW
jgi:hypothetical protein